MAQGRLAVVCLPAQEGQFVCLFFYLGTGTCRDTGMSVSFSLHFRKISIRLLILLPNYKVVLSFEQVFPIVSP